MTIVKKNSLGKRIFAFTLAVIMLFTTMPIRTNIAKAEGESGSTYTFHVVEKDSDTSIEGAVITIFSKADDEYSLTLEELKSTEISDETDTETSTKKVLKKAVTDKDGKAEVTLNLDEHSSENLAYTVTYTKTETITDNDEFTETDNTETVESTETVDGTETAGATEETKTTEYTIVRGSLTKDNAGKTEEITLKPAVGICGTICIGDENTKATLPFEVKLLNGKTEVTETKSYADGTFVFDDVTYEGNETYTIFVDTDSYEETSCQTTVNGFGGAQGLVDQGNLTLTEKLVPTTGSISGTIKDSDDTSNTVSGAAVYLVGGEVEQNKIKDVISTNENVTSTTTDENGTYQFSEIAFGTYTIIVTHSDYKTDKTDSITLSGTDSSVIEDISLRKKEELTLNVSFAEEEIDLLSNKDFDFSEITNTLSISKGNEEELTNTENSKLTISYSSSDTSVVEVDTKTGAFQRINGVGTATITATISSDEYKFKKMEDGSEVSNNEITITYTVNVWKFAFETEGLNTSGTISKTYGDESFSTKAILKGKDNTTKTIDIKDVEYSLETSVGETSSSNTAIIYTDANGNSVEGKENATDVKIQIIGASDETFTVSATYCGVTISYKLTVNRVGSLSDFAWQGYDKDTDVADGGSIVVKYAYGETPKEIVVPKIDGVTVEYESDNPDIVSVDENTGEISIHNVTDTAVTITARVTDTNNYDITPITYTIYVKKGTVPNLDWNETNLETLKADTSYAITNDETTGKLSQIKVSYKKGRAFSLGASCTDNENVSYAYTSSNLNVAEVNENTGEIQILGAGTTTITCTVTSDLYETKTISYLLEVTLAIQSITWEPINWKNPDDLKIEIKVDTLTVEYQKGLEYESPVGGQITNDGLSYKFSIEEIDNYKDVAEIDPDSGIVNIKNAGKTKICYTSGDGGKNYIPLVISYTLVVEKGKESLEWKKADVDTLKEFAQITENGTSIDTLPTTGGVVNIVYDETKTEYTLGTLGQNADLNYEYTVTGNEGNIITLDKTSGEVTIHKAGTVNITYKAVGDNPNYAVSELSYTLNITENPQSSLTWDTKNIPQGLDATKLSDTDGTVSMTYDPNFTSFKIGVTGQIVGQNLTCGFVETETEVAKVEADGTVTIKQAGTITVTYVSKDIDSGHYKEKTFTYNLIINQAEQSSVSLKKGSDSKNLVYSAGLTYTNAITTPVDNAVVTYTSSDTSIATVDANGMVSILKTGTVTITVSVAETVRYLPKTLSYTIVVEAGKQPLEWKQADVSNLTKIAQIQQADGTATNTLPKTGGVVNIVYDETKTEYTLGALGQNTDLTYQYTVAGNEAGVITLDGVTGKVTIHKAGKVIITYKAVGDNPNYEASELSYTLNITENPQSSLKWDTKNISQKLNATQLSDTQGTVSMTYDPNFTSFKIGVTGQIVGSNLTCGFVETETEVAKVEADGTVTIKQAGTIRITYVSQDINSGHYKRKELTYDLTIYKAEQSGVSWNNGSGNKELVYDADLTYTNAIKTPVDNASVTYTSSNTSVAVVDTAGKVSILKAGEVTITVSVGETVRYLPKTLQYNIKIEKGVQKISFTSSKYSFINGGVFSSPVASSDKYQADGVYTYTIADDTNGVVSYIHPNTGELSFTLQTGTVTIHVVREEDERYKGAEASYELTVKEWDPLANNSSNTYYSMNGAKEDISSVWYTKSDANNPIQLIASDGYQLYKGSIDPVPDSVWSQSIRVTDTHDGTDNGIVYYIRSEKTGYVSKQYTLDNIHIDTTVPNVSIEVDEATTWEKILSFFTFHLLGQDTPELKIKSGDTTSGVKQVLYYISNSTNPLEVNGLIDTNALEEEANWKNYTGAVDLLDESVTENVIYTKVIDNAGNSAYASTNGLIFDGTKPVVTPTIITEDSNGIYYGNVEINLNVTDPTPYSGIMQISYVVENGNEVTDSGTLFTFVPNETGNPTQEELVSSWNTKDFGKNVIVKAADNNSDNVKVSFVVTDNAGNTTESVVDLQIDITNPVINVQYNNNEGDTTFADGVYYNTDRMAVITIQERHFDPNKVKLVIENTDGVIPSLSGWTKISDGTGNGDNTTYQASVVFSADGDYTFDIFCEDNASNKNVSVNYGTSQAPTTFTIDKTIPTIAVSYDNNDVSNENYYKTDRVATVTIQEHNFDASRVNVILSATDDGQTVSAPVISSWSSVGDTHTATISYSSDALYTFDIEYTDKAGNEMADFTPETFYVDKTTPTVSITEITDLSANNEEKIGFVITATDTNFDVFTPVVTAVIQTEEGFITTQIDAGSISEITNGQVYTVDNLEKDGIYSITCTVTDKAGNEYTEVNLQRADGSTYVENRAGEDTLLMFSVNRNGSVFDIDSNTKELLTQYYVQNVTEDVVIHEVNTDELATYSLSLNGEALTEGMDYTVSNTGGGNEWMRYTYVVKQSLFAEEGEYVLVVSSTDSAENNAFSDVKNANVSFIVDRTAPVVTVTGMESNRSYQTDKQVVTLIPTDDGGILETLVVRLVEKDGTTLKEILNMSGETFRDTLEENGGIITFEIEEGLRQNVQIICGDGAYATDGTTNTYNQIFEDISVSQSAVAIFFAGDTILYIGGGVGATAVTGGGVVLFRKRKLPKFKKKVK